jgi:hypothetical protein
MLTLLFYLAEKWKELLGIFSLLPVARLCMRLQSPHLAPAAGQFQKTDGSQVAKENKYWHCHSAT